MASSPSSATPAETAAALRAVRARRVGWTAVVGVGAALGWIVVIERRGAAMGMGMGMAMHTDAVAFLGVWLAMVGAMMLPTIQPMVVTYAAMLARIDRTTRRSRIALFLLPYGVLWAMAGLGALGLWLFGRSHPVIAGALIVAAGLYQLGALKARCLRWCRSPLGFFMRYGDHVGSARGALSLGLRHAAVCFGCCVGLMVGLTGAGVMALSWLVALAVLMLMEKTHPAGQLLARAAGIGLVVLGATTSLIPLEAVTGEVAGAVALAAVVTASLVAFVGRPRPQATTA
jgi:predicted metal-binding membrane protein